MATNAPESILDPLGEANRRRLINAARAVAGVVLAVLGLLVFAAVLPDRPKPEEHHWHPDDTPTLTVGVTVTDGATLWLGTGPDRVAVALPCTTGGPAMVTAARSRVGGGWTVAGYVPDGIPCPGTDPPACPLAPWVAIVSSTGTFTPVAVPAGVTTIDAVERDNAGRVSVRFSGSGCMSATTAAVPSPPTTTVIPA